MTTAPEPPFHIVPTANTSLSAFGISLVPGGLYRVEESDIEAERDDLGRSWLEHLDDDAQRRRWGAVKLRVVEVEAAVPGRTLVSLRALENVALQGRGRLVAGERLILPADMAAELPWLAPAVQLAAHGHQVLAVEPYEPGEDTAS